MGSIKSRRDSHKGHHKSYEPYCESHEVTPPHAGDVEIKKPGYLSVTLTDTTNQWQVATQVFSDCLYDMEHCGITTSGYFSAIPADERMAYMIMLKLAEDFLERNLEHRGSVNEAQK